MRVYAACIQPRISAPLTHYESVDIIQKAPFQWKFRLDLGQSRLLTLDGGPMAIDA